MTTAAPNLSVKRFYSLEYFYILLLSVFRHSGKPRVFESFKDLKQQYRLGESKFKKITADPVNLTPTQLQRYWYTFDQVIEESLQYGLITVKDESSLSLTKDGLLLLESYGTSGFQSKLFELMERHSQAFRYFISRLYEVNTDQHGLLVFPFYSPHQAGITRKSLKTTDDIRMYADVLTEKLASHLQTNVGQSRDLSPLSKDFISRIIDSKLLPEKGTAPFDPRNYNVIVSRFRKFWLTYFLTDVYGFDTSLSTFDIWVYRGKQFGVLHVTDFYPSFHGRIVYPTSVVVAQPPADEFRLLYDYGDKSLYLHEPIHSQVDASFDETFVGSLVNWYYAMRRNQRAYFVNLASLRELVCYQLRISESTFGVLLDKAYRLNLAGNLRVQISLEVDKLPEDTRESYLKQEPVIVDGKPRNIIAIETKGAVNG